LETNDCLVGPYAGLRKKMTSPRSAHLKERRVGRFVDRGEYSGPDVKGQSEEKANLEKMEVELKKKP